MTRLLLIIALLILSFSYVNGQKVNSYTYKKVDTFYQYKNAEIIIYTNNGKQHSDTLYFPLKMNVTIEEVSEVIVDDKVKLKPKKQ